MSTISHLHRGPKVADISNPHRRGETEAGGVAVCRCHANGMMEEDR